MDLDLGCGSLDAANLMPRSSERVHPFVHEPLGDALVFVRSDLINGCKLFWIIEHVDI